MQMSDWAAPGMLGFASRCISDHTIPPKELQLATGADGSALEDVRQGTAGNATTSVLWAVSCCTQQHSREMHWALTGYLILDEYLNEHYHSHWVCS